MRYKCCGQHKKDDTKGGDYWRDVNIGEHFQLTQYQTSYHYVLDTFSPDKSILEAGCGLGRWIIPLSKERYRVTGLEIEEDAVNFITKNFSADNLRVVQGDIFKMPFDDKSFDLVISLGVLEHFEDRKTINNAISEHLRVLEDDGVFFVTVPYLSVLRLLFHWPFIRLVSLVRLLKGKKEYFTEYRYSSSTFQRILKSNKLKIVEVVWDDFRAPYSFGLTVDYPLKQLTKSTDGKQYKLNKTGLLLQKILWKVHPCIISGGVGFACKKTWSNGR